MSNQDSRCIYSTCLFMDISLQHNIIFKQLFFSSRNWHDIKLMYESIIELQGQNRDLWFFFFFFSFYFSFNTSPTSIFSTDLVIFLVILFPPFEPIFLVLFLIDFFPLTNFLIIIDLLFYFHLLSSSFPAFIFQPKFSHWSSSFFPTPLSLNLLLVLLFSQIF